MQSLVKGLTNEVKNNVNALKRDMQHDFNTFKKDVQDNAASVRKDVQYAADAVKGGFKSFFDASKFAVEVHIDKPNALGMHILGGAVTGLVVIRASAPATVRGFSLKHAVRMTFDELAYADVDEKHTSSNNASSSSQQDASQKRAVHSKVKKAKPIYANELLLFGSRKGAEIIVQPGEYKYSFAIQLPPWLPGSFCGETVSEFSTCCDCCCKSCGTSYVKMALRHSLDVQVIIANSFLDHNYNQEFNVQRAAENEHLHLPKPIVRQVNSGVGTGCCGCCVCSSDRIALDIHLPRRDWILGVDQGIVGYVNGSSTCSFEVSLMSRLTVDKNCAKGSLKNADFRVTETVISRHVQQVGNRSASSSRVDNLFFELPLPSDLPASFGELAAKAFQCSVEYFVSIRPFDMCCTTQFADDVHIPVLLSKALSAPKIQEPQMLAPPPMIPMPDLAAMYGSGGAASFEYCYAYAPPHMAIGAVTVDGAGAGAGAGVAATPPNIAYEPAAPILEEGLPNAVWGVPLGIAEDVKLPPPVNFGPPTGGAAGGVVDGVPVQQKPSPQPMM